MKSEVDILAIKIDRRLDEGGVTKRRAAARNEVLNERKAQIKERLEKIKEVRTELGYATDEKERARRIELNKNLDKLENTLKEEANLREKESRLNTNLISAEDALERVLKNTNLASDKKIAAIKSADEKKIDPIRKDILETLDKVSENASQYDEFGGSRKIYSIVTTCPAKASAGIYPKRNPLTEKIGLAILDTLKSEKAVSRGTGGRSIGIAELKDGTIVITMSGTKAEVQPSMDILERNAKKLDPDRKILFVSDEVPNLKLATPLQKGVAPPTKKCAMPKIYFVAQQSGTEVLSPTEVWWDGGKIPAPKNPCPDQDDDHFMYPCEFCAWNAKSVQDGTAWKKSDADK